MNAIVEALRDAGVNISCRELLGESEASWREILSGLRGGFVPFINSTISTEMNADSAFCLLERLYTLSGIKIVRIKTTNEILFSRSIFSIESRKQSAIVVAIWKESFFSISTFIHLW